MATKQRRNYLLSDPDMIIFAVSRSSPLQHPFLKTAKPLVSLRALIEAARCSMAKKQQMGIE